MSKKAARKKTLTSLNETPEQAEPAKEQDDESHLIGESWVTDYAWISGVTGAILIILLAYWYSEANILRQGITVFDMKITTGRQDSVLAAVIITSFVMVLIELVRLILREGKNFISVDPLIKEKRYDEFFKQCAIVYILNLLLLWLAFALYHAFGTGAGWDKMLDWIWNIYVYGAVIYIPLTRAFKHDPDSDSKDYPNLVSKVLWFIFAISTFNMSRIPEFGLNEKKAALGLAVKAFFAPLMTQFFFNQFPTLVSNMGYVVDHLFQNIAAGKYSHQTFNKDFFNIAKAVIFSIDVGLAWCGYIVSLRWVDNQTKSAEPTLKGWAVCLISYPPFQMIGLYFMIPSENQILNFSDQWVITFFITLSVICYFVYMSATLVFGVRFSNLTNRGIIRTGPFAFVRHPAYASKNIGWWCVMFPAILLNADRNGTELSIVLTVGLILMSWFYYMRAITEEQHLSADPYYRAYCKQVKYRFIPGLI